MFEKYKRKQCHWVIPERSPKEIYERWLEKCHFPLLSMKGNRKMCSHTFIEVMYYAGQDIFVVAHSRLAYYILFYLLLASHRVITYMFSLWLILGYPVGGECIWVALASTHF